MSNTEQSASTLSSLGNTLSAYGKLLIEDTRLSVAEKLTRALSAIALCSMLVLLVMAAIVFVSIAAGLWLSSVMEPSWAFVIVAAFYIVVAIVLIACRTALLVNPISRFITRLVLPAPKKTVNDDKPATVS